MRLTFYDFTDMVIFFCIFLAIRAQDNGVDPVRVYDHELDLEEPLFEGYVNINHELIVFFFSLTNY